MSELQETEQEDIRVALRKLRKRLRQIESLEKLTRPLTSEEIQKVKSKDDCRDSLQNFLKLAEDFDVSVTTSEVTLDNENTIPPISHDDESRSTDSVQLPSPNMPESNSNTSQDLVPLSQEISENDNIPSTVGIVQSNKKDEIMSSENETGLNSSSEPRKRKRESSRKSEKQKLLEMKSRWSKSKFFYLDSHHDKICSLAMNKETFLSASKDTTCKVWNKCGEVQHTLGDHTSSVTGAFVLGNRICTTSYDCKLRMWDTKTGKLEFSQYLFSPITCAVIFDKTVLIGTDGGKIKLYCTEALAVKWESVGHSETVSSLALDEKTAISASAVPDLCVWKILENCASKVPVKIPVTRTVRCMIIHNDKLYFGDDGVNIKVYDFKSDTLDKLKNHDSDHGSTDSMVIFENQYLVSSSYNLDSGSSSLNFRSLKDHSYIFTVKCPVYGPITCLSCDTSSDSADSLQLLCGGSELGVIKQDKRDQSPDHFNESETVEVIRLEALQDKFVDSLSEAFSSDEEEGAIPYKTQKRSSDDTVEPTSSGSWCTIA